MTSMTTVSTMRKDLRSLGGGKEEHLNSLLIFARLLTLLSLSLFLSVHKISTKTIQKQKRTNKITSHPSIDFAKVKRFALSVYDRADQRDRRKMFTKELVDAFDASAAFLYCLESQIFKPYKEQGCDFDEDLRQRAEYAEWRAYDVAMALRSGRKPTEVADAFDEDCSSGRELNAGLAGMSLAAAAPPPLDLPKDVLKQPEERPNRVAKEDKVEKEGEEAKEGTRQAQADQGVPAELAKLGINAADWEKIQATLKTDVSGSRRAVIPEDYRGLVQKYFEQVSKKK